jgi:spectrin beta
MSNELGHTIDEVENLIKKHEAFEKSAAAQEERFSALERLTTVSIQCEFHLILSFLNQTFPF